MIHRIMDPPGSSFLSWLPQATSGGILVSGSPVHTYFYACAHFSVCVQGDEAGRIVWSMYSKFWSYHILNCVWATVWLYNFLPNLGYYWVRRGAVNNCLRVCTIIHSVLRQTGVNTVVSVEIPAGWAASLYSRWRRAQLTMLTPSLGSGEQWAHIRFGKENLHVRMGLLWFYLL